MKTWISAARPQTLPAALVPVAVGTACAYASGGMQVLPAIAALLGAIFIQIGTNFANDVFDAEKGADGPDRLGPVRAVSAGLISARSMRVAMGLAFGAATLCGVYLMWIGGWPILAIGIASILSGIAYTGGPFPLGYHGLGDVFVMIFFGFVAVTGTVYVQVGSIPPIAWISAAAVGALTTAILVVNNVRDRHTDVRAGKRTLAVRLGKRGALIEQAILYLIAYAVPIALVPFCGPTPLVALATLPFAVYLWRELWKREGPPLNGTLVGTARLLAAHGALLSVGIALGA
jgi:1,4-dihydroxy-2-naphthoate polyprenyltransferase